MGYTTDFNRATAQTAQEVTEEQVFQPERKSLAWAINNRLLNCYRFKYVEVYFMEPDISNPDDLYRMLSAANNAGGVTPNFAHELICEMTGKPSEDFQGEWGEVPVAVLKNKGTNINYSDVVQQLSGQIAKAQEKQEPDEIVAVMKEVRRVLMDIKKQAG